MDSLDLTINAPDLERPVIFSKSSVMVLQDNHDWPKTSMVKFHHVCILKTKEKLKKTYFYFNTETQQFQNHFKKLTSTNQIS
jgi:hypothetical protein